MPWRKQHARIRHQGFVRLPEHQDDDAYGWLQPIKHEHFDVEKNDPMTAELEHFVDLCLGRETTPRCTGDNALDTLKVINAIQKSAEDETPVKL